MEIKHINELLTKQHKGTFVRIGWTSNIESAKARNAGISVVKETDATVRWGVIYDHLKRVKEIKATTQPSTANYKPWYKHIEGCPHIIEHLSDPSKTYLQLFTINKKNSMKARYYINGVEKTKQEVIDSGYVNNSEWAPKGECLIMNIPTSNIRFIGKEV